MQYDDNYDIVFFVSLAVLPDGRLASGSEDETIRVWDLGRGTCVRVLKGHEGVREGDGYTVYLREW